MRLLGLDLGEKTIGVSVSDPLGLTAQGVTVIRRRGIEGDLARIKELCDDLQVHSIVLGLPINMDGSRGKQVEKVENFATLVRDRLKLPVVLWDERLTTAAAEKTLLEADVTRKKRRQVIDKMAAILILQGYLNRLRSDSS
ncbi:MAG: Holliday junction resolvase RuvX [Firmicutes bacterium]|nr:Holliday junction resolvase RuvX [Bacillota bacterium]